MRKPLIIANWKMNPPTVKEAVLLAHGIERGASRYRNVEVIVAPPFHFLMSLGRVLKRVHLGAQDSAWAEAGPYTGEVSWLQLQSIGVRHVIVGHSERRLHMGETDDMIQKKVDALLRHGMTPIVCIGERMRIGNDIPAVVGDQLKTALNGIARRVVKNLVVAYEPIWAISTVPGARPDTPDNAFRTKVYIQKILTGLYGRAAAQAVRIIYGGSVRSENAAPFLKEGKMDGALVGGASLDSGEFIRIIHASSTIA